MMQLTSVVMILTLMAASTLGQQPYNSNKQICCDGEVHDVPDSVDDYRCCGSHQVYNYKEYLCCQNYDLIPLPEGNYDKRSYSKYQCCMDRSTGQSVAYNTSSHVCCDGQLNEKKETLLNLCCGKESINPKTQFCCDNQIYESNLNQQCCAGKEIYDKTSQICCAEFQQAGNNWTMQSQIHDLTSNTMQCCGLEIYDKKTHFCCEGTIKELPDDISADGAVTKCCGGEAYNRNTQQCCSKWQLIDGKFQTTTSKINDKTKKANLCCGLNAFDHHQEVCCANGNVLPKPEGSKKERQNMFCCGSEVITLGNQRCLNNTVIIVNKSTSRSCGDDFYDPATQYCCYNEVYDLINSDDTTVDSCCFGARKAYNSNTHLCCGNNIVPREDVGAEDVHDSCCTPNYQSIPNY